MVPILQQEKSYKHCPLTPLTECLPVFSSAVETTLLLLKLHPLPEVLKSESPQAGQWLYSPLSRSYPYLSHPTSPDVTQSRQFFYPNIFLVTDPQPLATQEARKAQPAGSSSTWRPKVQFSRTPDGTASGGVGLVCVTTDAGVPLLGAFLSAREGSLLIRGLSSRGGFQRQGNLSTSNWEAIEKFLNTKPP